MAKDDPYPGNPLQPKPVIIENKPATSVSEALKNAANQVKQAK